MKRLVLVLSLTLVHFIALGQSWQLTGKVMPLIPISEIQTEVYVSIADSNGVAVVGLTQDCFLAFGRQSTNVKTFFFTLALIPGNGFKEVIPGLYHVIFKGMFDYVYLRVFEREVFQLPGSTHTRFQRGQILF